MNPENRKPEDNGPEGIEPSPSSSRQPLESGSSPILPLYEQVAPRLAAWTRIRLSNALRDRVPAEDFLQEVWCRALVGYATFDPSRGDFPGWIFGIARNLLIELIRHHARRGGAAAAAFPLSQIADDATAISQRACADEALRELSRVIASLDEADRDLVVWRGLEGLSHDVVAERLGLSRDAVMKRWQRLREDLRKRIPQGSRLLDSTDGRTS